MAMLVYQRVVGFPKLNGVNAHIAHAIATSEDEFSNSIFVRARKRWATRIQL